MPYGHYRLPEIPAYSEHDAFEDALVLEMLRESLEEAVDVVMEIRVPERLYLVLDVVLQAGHSFEVP